MEAVIFTFTGNGARLGEKVADFFCTQENMEENSVLVYAMDKFCPISAEQSLLSPYKKPTAEYVKESFSKDALIFIGAAGIAVRMIAPLIKHKTTDPCVLVLDELGKFVIPILSGHMGGGNDLALSISSFLGSTPVITTATDVNCLFAVDSFAVKNNFVIDNLTLAKEISAALLEKKTVGIFSQFAVPNKEKEHIPSCLTWISDESAYSPAYLIQISVNCIPATTRVNPNHILHLIPKAIVLGIGCRRGIRCEQIEQLVFPTLEKYNIDPRAVFGAATIDLKADEPGLIEFCRKNHWDLVTYSAEQLSHIQGSFTGSDFVKSITGVDNVCERAALASAGTTNLWVPKHSLHGVTMAVAMRQPEMKF